jgi:hypothetical protein
MLAPLALAAALLAGDPKPTPKACDHATTGTDCQVFAAADVDGDGGADVLTVNGNGALCAAFAVLGHKASPWEALAEGLPGGALAIRTVAGVAGVDGIVVEVAYPDRALRFGEYGRNGGSKLRRLEPDGAPFAASSTSPVAVDPPPYEPGARRLLGFGADLDGDGLDDGFEVFDCTRPHPHRLVRVAITPNAASGDSDADGLSDEVERALGTDPLDRDTDDDGLPDGFEVNGLPRGVSAGAETRLDPRRQDVICAVAPYAGIDVAVLRAELAKVKELYRSLDTSNPDGSRGIELHFRIDPEVPRERQFGGSWVACGNAHLKDVERGLLHWMQVTPGGGGQAQQTGDMGGCGLGHAVFAHEFGHQLSLSHEGDSRAAWCPLYPSLMNYAFSYQLGGDAAAIRFSDGRFRDVALDERNLVERLPFPLADVQYLAAWPFRFTLEADGQTATRIDWNHDGRFDEAPVVADVNYGGSTHGGERRNLGIVGSGPALAFAGDRALLVHSDPQQARLLLRVAKEGESWSEPRELPRGATRGDPLLIGGERDALVIVATAIGHSIARIGSEALDPGASSPAMPVLRPIPGLRGGELGACRVGERLLVIRRDGDDALSAHWLAFEGDEPQLTPAQALELRSQTAVGVGLVPGGEGEPRVVVATAARNSRGGDFCLRASWFAVKGDALVHEETRFTRGEASGNHCTTRPVVSFTPDGRLCIFHTGWPSDDGLMTMWRTTRVGNEKLDEGWLTCLMYDVWTVTRAPVAFARKEACAGDLGDAIFAFRWDAGDAHGMHTGDLLIGHNGFGLDAEPMRDFDDAEKIAKWGIRHSILNMRRQR